ncbi:MAG TPA: transposase, partial [Ktedonobacteraceae bacterium]|nr:transposase [Ktedonobacteraceae bacterium]
VDSLKPRFFVEAHLNSLFGIEAADLPEEAGQQTLQAENTSSEVGEQEEVRSPISLPVSLSQEEQEELSEQNAQHHNWIEQLGAQHRSVTSPGYQRLADLLVSTTDPDATLMESKQGSDMGYRTHYVVDGGKARIILAALVTPFEVTDNLPMLDLIWRTRFRWKLWPRQVTGDRRYGTEDNLVAIEDQDIRAYIPIPDMDHRTQFFSSQQFTYDAERDIYVCPAGKELHFDQPHSTDRSLRYRAHAKDCNHCPLKAQCTTSQQGRTLCRSIDEDCLDRVRSYASTQAYKKALRKRQVWVEPLFAEGKQWHGMRRFRLRRLWRVNCEAQMRAAGQNLKRLLKKWGWGRRPWPQAAASALSEPLSEDPAPMRAEQALACEQHLHVKDALKTSFVYQSCLLFFCYSDADLYLFSSCQDIIGPGAFWLFSAPYSSPHLFRYMLEHRRREVTGLVSG